MSVLVGVASGGGAVGAKAGGGAGVASMGCAGRWAGGGVDARGEGGCMAGVQRWCGSVQADIAIVCRRGCVLSVQAMVGRGELASGSGRVWFRGHLGCCCSVVAVRGELQLHDGLRAKCCLQHLPWGRCIPRTGCPRVPASLKGSAGVM